MNNPKKKLRRHARLLNCFSRVQLFAALWTVALSTGFSRKEHWSGLPCPPPGDLPDPGMEAECPASPALQMDSLPLVPPGKPNLLYNSI